MDIPERKAMTEGKQFAARCWQRPMREFVITGAVWAGATTWLVSLLLAAFWAVDQHYHPFVFVYSLVLVPGLTTIGSLFGAAGGLVVAIIRQRRSPGADGRPGYVAQLLRRGAIMIATGTALIFIGSIVGAECEYQKIARLIALGGTIDPELGEVSFPDGSLSDHDLPAVVECLNRSEQWYVLNLAGTNVTGDGLIHLQKITNKTFRLELSIEQLDENGLNHIRQLKYLANIDDIRTTAAAADRKTAQENRPPGGE